MTAQADSGPVPVHVLTGFLGSGKTTLLNRLLSMRAPSETAVLVNEFGDAALDQDFIQTASAEVLVLRNGCICCSIRSDLVETLMELADLRGRGEVPRFKRVVVETSGISDPLPILTTLQAEFTLLSRYRPGAVVCTVDAAVHAADGALPPEGLTQLCAADAVVVTKRDLVADGAACAADKMVRALNPAARLLPSEGAELTEFLERRERGEDHGPHLDPAVAAPVPRAASHGVRSLVLREASPPSWPSFAVWLTRLVFVHGDRLLRTKGILFDRERGVWVGVNGVRRFFHPPVHLTLDRSVDEACIVFITRDLDPALIAHSYRRLVAQDHECADGPALV